MRSVLKPMSLLMTKWYCIITMHIRPQMKATPANCTNSRGRFHPFLPSV